MILHHAVLMLNAKLSVIPHLALAWQNLLVHHQTAGQNAFLTANAQITWLVLIKNAKIHAPELVDKTPNVV